MKSLVWKSTAESNIGTVRKVNEDDYYDAPQACLWCVADGMGGHSRGDVASQMITEQLSLLVSNHPETLSVKTIVDCLQDVNRMLVELSQQHQSIVGSTVVVLFFEQDKAHFIWAGDSRIYRLRQNTLARVTRDHSQVEDMIDAGLIRPEEAESHPKANVITRAVGANNYLELDVKTLDLNKNDQFFLCSDGINKVISDREIEHALLTMSSSTIAHRLIEISLARKARDNITLIVVRHPSESEDEQEAQVPALDDTLPLNYTSG